MDGFPRETLNEFPRQSIDLETGRRHQGVAAALRSWIML
jgi:hypothetical protein